MNQFYREYLDADIDRHGTDCSKWDHLKDVFGREDLVAAWVADMDFRTAPEIIEALQKRAAHGIFGYTDDFEAQHRAEVGWLKRRHDFEAQPEWIQYSPGVVDTLFFCVRALTEPGDAVLIQPPVYGPFYGAARAFGRELAFNPLRETETGWEMDFDDLEAKLSRKDVKLMILCNPHNPIGRVWNRTELERVVALTKRFGVTLVSDEIHADFTFDGHKMTRILSLPDSDHCVMLTSATKSFNLAALRQSSYLAKDPALREKIAKEINLAHAGSPNVFGGIAQTVAYEKGDAWMDAVVEYIGENRDWAVDFLHSELPEIRVRPQEGTYLLWLDCAGLGMEHDALAKMLVNEAHVGLGNGRDFGPEGDRHFRVNLATPRRNVVRAMENIKNAIRSR